MGTHQSRIDQAMADYDMIEEYFYPLSDDDFNNRYVSDNHKPPFTSRNWFKQD